MSQCCRNVPTNGRDEGESSPLPRSPSPGITGVGGSLGDDGVLVRVDHVDVCGWKCGEVVRNAFSPSLEVMVWPCHGRAEAERSTCVANRPPGRRWRREVEWYG